MDVRLSLKESNTNNINRGGAASVLVSRRNPAPSFSTTFIFLGICVLRKMQIL